jgi:hypothetical protein
MNVSIESSRGGKKNMSLGWGKLYSEKNSFNKKIYKPYKKDINLHNPHLVKTQIWWCTWIHSLRDLSNMDFSDARSRRQPWKWWNPRPFNEPNKSMNFHTTTHSSKSTSALLKSWGPCPKSYCPGVWPTPNLAILPWSP